MRSVSWGRDIIIHLREKKNHIDMCLILNGYRYRAVRNYKYERNMNSNKEKLHNVNFILNLI